MKTTTCRNLQIISTVAAAAFLIIMVGIADSPRSNLRDVVISFVACLLFTLAAVIFSRFHYIVGYILASWVLFRFRFTPLSLTKDSYEYVTMLLWMSNWRIRDTKQFMAWIYFQNVQKRELGGGSDAE